jgi:hypothetical protein
MAAKAGDVLDEVIASLGDAWSQQANYNLERVLVHGLRRAAEMQEVEHTLRDLGVAPRMTQGAVAWQGDLGALQISPAPLSLAEKLAAIGAVHRAEVA